MQASTSSLPHQGVDGRDKPGHDDDRDSPGSRNATWAPAFAVAHVAL
jgi:hypothetical protein